MSNFLNNLISSAQGSSYSMPKANTTSAVKQLTQTKYPQSVAPVAPIKTTTTPTQFVANPTRTPVNVISANNLNTQPVTKPQITPVTTAQNNLKSSVNIYSASPTELTTPTPTPATPVKSERDTTLSRIKELVGMQGSKGTDTLKAQEDENLAQKREALAKANTAQLRLDQAYEKEVEAINKNPEGVSDTGLKVRLADAERAYLDKKADIAIDRLASQGDVETALKIVEDKIKAKYEPIDNEIKGLQTYLQAYANDLTENEKLQVQATIQEKEAQAKFARDKELASYEAKLKQSDPLYQAQLSKARNEANESNPLVINQKAQTEALSNVSLVDELLKDNRYENVVGINKFNPFNYVPGTEVQYAKNQFNQLKSNLSLENRQKLKGSGAISDFEFKVLAQASSALGSNLSNADARKELNKIKGVFTTASGMPTIVKITDPKTQRSVTVSATREGINQAIIDGAIVEYQ